MSSPRPHFVLIPSAGMGHIAPFCRLAAALASRNSSISFITTTLPPVSSAESLHTSHLVSSFPSIRLLHLPLSPLHPSQYPPDSDPFYIRYESIRSSAHLLPSLLSSSSSSSPVSALIVDIGISSAFIPIARQLNLPSFVHFTTSAAMLSLYAYLPTYFSTTTTENDDDIHIPGVCTFPKSSVLPGMDNRNHFFARQVIGNSLSFANADGILINTFEAIESERLAALNAKKVTPDLPPVIPIGPLKPIRGFSSSSSYSRWLDEQPPRSVVYVSFGSRTAMAAEQIRELGIGLETSGQRFLWVIKTKRVDREEESEESKVEEILGEGYRERVKGRGLVVNGWVEQEEVLKHGAIGGFLSHCGWNSVMEAAMAGVRVMAWPRGADQRVNGEVVRRSGMGVWMEKWWWEVEEGVVGGEEIGRRVREMMEDGGLREKVERVAVEARKAGEVGGTSYRKLDEFVSRFETK